MKEEVAKHLQSPPDDWWERDLSRGYPWLKDGEELHWVIDEEDGTSVVVIHFENQDWTRTNDDPQAPLLDVVNNLLPRILSEAPNPPEAILRVLATCIFTLAHDPRGHLLEPVFLTLKADTLDSYAGLGGGQPADFVKPLLFQESDGSWKLEFVTFDHEGEVIGWFITGSQPPRRILGIDRSTVAPPGTLTFPEEF